MKIYNNDLSSQFVFGSERLEKEKYVRQFDCVSCRGQPSITCATCGTDEGPRQQTKNGLSCILTDKKQNKDYFY